MCRHLSQSQVARPLHSPPRQVSLQITLFHYQCHRPTPLLDLPLAVLAFHHPLPLVYQLHPVSASQCHLKLVALLRVLCPFPSPRRLIGLSPDPPFNPNHTHNLPLLLLAPYFPVQSLLVKQSVAHLHTMSPLNTQQALLLAQQARRHHSPPLPLFSQNPHSTLFPPELHHLFFRVLLLNHQW